MVLWPELPRISPEPSEVGRVLRVRPVDSFANGTIDSTARSVTNVLS